MRIKSLDFPREDKDLAIDAILTSSPHCDEVENRRSFTSAKYDVSRHSETLDRRKVEKAMVPAQLTANGSHTLGLQSLSSRQLPLTSDLTADKTAEGREKRRWRMQSPWACSPLTLVLTSLSIIALFSIIHSFLTRQVDPKGCDMCYTREIIYYEFADFDTEHTRFATKYSLHLIREQGFDEDPKVYPHPNQKSSFEAYCDPGQRCSGSLYSGKCRQLQTSSLPGLRGGPILCE